jgi:hypothetical protein
MLPVPFVFLKYGAWLREKYPIRLWPNAASKMDSALDPFIWVGGRIGRSEGQGVNSFLNSFSEKSYKDLLELAQTRVYIITNAAGKTTIVTI